MHLLKNSGCIAYVVPVFYNNKKTNRSFLKQGAVFPKKPTSCVMLKHAWKI
jgi:hypothetical protein